jgi:hypothetical protein
MPGCGAGKRFDNGIALPFSCGSAFTVAEEPIRHSQDFFMLLDRIQHDRRLFLIRGRLREEHRDVLETGEPVRKTCHPQEDGYPAIFEAAPHRWLMLDMDDVPLLYDGTYAIDPTDLQLVGAMAIDLLPPEFREVTHWQQLTGSAGIKPGGRIRLAYWLDRAITDQQAKRWFRRCRGVDCMLFSPVQARFTARPRFTNMAEPVSGPRSGWDFTMTNEVVVPDHVCAPPPKPKPRMVIAGTAPSGQARRYADGCLRALARATEGDRHPTAVRVAIRLFSLAQARELDERWVAGTLKATLRTHGDRFATDTGDHEINDILTWAWQHGEPRELDR